MANPVNSKPQLLAFLTCDSVHVDPGSGKHTILGIFSGIKAHSFPVVHPFMVWFITLSDLSKGQHNIRISFGHDTGPARELINRPFEANSPLQRINLINEIRNLPFERPGEYSIIIEVDDELVLATNISASN